MVRKIATILKFNLTKSTLIYIQHSHKSILLTKIKQEISYEHE